MIVAIDGPSGAGKSTVAKAAAKRLGFSCLDTGAMYRAIAWKALADGVSFDDAEALGAIARDNEIEFGHVEGDPVPRRVFISGTEVTDAIRTSEIDRAVGPVAAVPAVREALVAQQQRIGRAGDYVVEGRDIGTVVFPEAPVKVFLTASAEELTAALAKEQAAQPNPAEEETSERKPYGFITVSCGDGLSEIFKGIGADYLIEGGQTMNPSTEDMLNAIKKVNADHIFILPNNKNIIMAANQARDLTEDKEIIVIPSKTVPQGITALVNFIPDLTPEENLENMTAEMERVQTAQITYAVRNTSIDGMEIHEGDIMAIGDHGMLAVDTSVLGAAKAALEAMLNEDSELVTIYYGSDVTEADAEAFRKQAEEEFPDKEIELQYGGQPIYYYMISAE